jgi:hypothetical protein
MLAVRELRKLNYPGGDILEIKNSGGQKNGTGRGN